MAGHGKAAVLARVARAWGALVVTLSVAGRVWYVRVFFKEGGCGLVASENALIVAIATSALPGSKNTRLRGLDRAAPRLRLF